MIFYFSGTGNSAAAAQKLLMEGEQLVSMSESLCAGKTVFEISKDETIGFVFPVYFYGLPETVRRFSACLHFSERPGYVYAVITCGGSIGGAGELLQKQLAASGIHLRAVYSVKMPDNYVLLYEATPQDQQDSVLAAADQHLEKITESIRLRRFEGLPASMAAKGETRIVYPFYDITRKTDKFYADESCIGCGACAARCPSQAIEMADGKPKWIKASCDHCLSCVRCPAVQFGNRLKHRLRYEHPNLRK